MTATPIDITEVRRQLVARSQDAFKWRKPYSDAMFSDDATVRESADTVAWTGLVQAEVFTFTLAAVLRRAERLNPDVAQRLAVLVQFALNSGLDWLEDANADLDEQAPLTPSTTAELHATFGPPMPGVGKSLAAALMENDVPAEPETTPAVAS